MYPRRLCSCDQDTASGLYWMRMRHYSPDLGRFLQPDPAGIAGGINLYAYSHNNPLRFFDPWGLWPAPDASGSSDGKYGESDPSREKTADPERKTQTDDPLAEAQAELDRINEAARDWFEKNQGNYKEFLGHFSNHQCAEFCRDLTNFLKETFDGQLAYWTITRLRFHGPVQVFGYDLNGHSLVGLVSAVYNPMPDQVVDAFQVPAYHRSMWARREIWRDGIVNTGSFSDYRENYYPDADYSFEGYPDR